MATNEKASEKNNLDEHEVIGWCGYCKDPIYDDDDYVKNNGSLHHVDCWKQENNIVEELKFD